MAESADPKGQCWPDEQQELLLRAALLRGEGALSAWDKWRSRVNPDSLDAGSARLLPLLYRNLPELRDNDPLVTRLKESYRTTWSLNQSLFRQMASLLGSLHEAGIETLVLKGGALAPRYYRDYGVRPMVDFDILVREERARTVMDSLAGSGWTSKYKSPAALIPYEHSTEFHDGAGRKLDLHWRVFWEGSREVTDEEFWSGAVAVEIHGVRTLILNPADQLLHVCVHGAKWDVCPPLRWVADALTILRSIGTEMDWNRLHRQAQTRRLLLPLSDTLAYLEKFENGSVPAKALELVKRRGVEGRMERFTYEVRLGPSRPLRAAAVLWQWSNTFRFSRRPGLRPKMIEFLSYLKCLWGIKHTWQVPLHIIHKSARALGGIAALGIRRLAHNRAANSRAGLSD